MANDHDHFDHAAVAAAHPAVQTPTVSGRLSWQHAKTSSAPANWKIGAVFVGLLIFLAILNWLNNERAAARFQRGSNDVRDNIVTLATAAAAYMDANHVTSVTDAQLLGSGPGQLADNPPQTFFQENYTHIIFSRAVPTVWVHIPSSNKRLYFHIKWNHPGTPEFVALERVDPPDD